MGQIDTWGNEEPEAEPLTYEQKIDEAKSALKLAADISLEYYKKPLIITYSGGKDSDVMLDIALQCLNSNEMEVMNSHTTVDAPETVRHIENVFRKLSKEGIKTSYKNRFPVEKTMWELIVEKQFPPTRLARYCCEQLKESSTPNRIIAVGVREDESRNRKGRDAFICRGDRGIFWTLSHAEEVFADAKKYDEAYDCTMVVKAKENADLICNPIYKLTEQEIWRYISDNKLDVNPLYARGYRRVGCVLCPLGGRNSMLKEAADFPKYKQAYIRAFDRMLDARRESGKDDVTGKSGDHVWRTGQDVYDWWVNGGCGIKGQLSFADQDGLMPGA